MILLSYDIHKNEFRVHVPYDQRDIVKQIRGYRFDFTHKCWCFPATKHIYQQLRSIFPKMVEEPNMWERIEKRSEQLEWMQKYQDLSKVDLNELEYFESKTTPMLHQKVAYTLAKDKHGFGLFMEPGTGKTKVCVDLIGYYFKERNMKRILVVCPLSVIYTWVNELKTHASYDYLCVPLEGTTENKIEQLKSLPKPTRIGKPIIVVTNYDSLYRMEKELFNFNPDIVIADEAHKTKNHESKTAKALYAISQTAQVRLALTGTPIGNNPLDVFGIYKFIDFRIFGSNYNQFRSLYADVKYVGERRDSYGRIIKRGFPSVQGYRNTDILSDKMYQHAYRVTKEEAIDLPDLVSITIPVTLEQKALDLYKKLEEEQILEIERYGETDYLKANKAVTFIVKASQITGGTVKLVSGKILQVSDAKLLAIKEILEGVMDGRRKVVIFARFIGEINRLMEELTNEGYSVEVITGETKHRDRIIDSFQDDDKPEIIILQTKTAGVGITLHRADTVIFYSYDYSYIDYDQAIARVYRNGQKNKTTVYHLVAEGTVDEDILQAIQNKQDIAKRIVDKFKEGKVS